MKRVTSLTPFSHRLTTFLPATTRKISAGIVSAALLAVVAILSGSTPAPSKTGGTILHFPTAGSPTVTPSFSQDDPSLPREPVCGWCVRREEDDGFSEHHFPSGGNGCQWPPPYPTPNHSSCDRRGGTSSCHRAWWEGDCHIACGPDGDRPGGFDDVVAAIQTGLEERDMAGVAASVAAQYPSSLAVEYVPEAGRIDFVLACNPDAPASTLPVPTGDLRLSLEAELAALSMALPGGTVAPSP